MCFSQNSEGLQLFITYQGYPHPTETLQTNELQGEVQLEYWPFHLVIRARGEGWALQHLPHFFSAKTKVVYGPHVRKLHDFDLGTRSRNMQISQTKALCGFYTLSWNEEKELLSMLLLQLGIWCRMIRFWGSWSLSVFSKIDSGSWRKVHLAVDALTECVHVWSRTRWPESFYTHAVIWNLVICNCYMLNVWNCV